MRIKFFSDTSAQYKAPHSLFELGVNPKFKDDELSSSDGNLLPISTLSLYAQAFFGNLHNQVMASGVARPLKFVAVLLCTAGMLSTAVLAVAEAIIRLALTLFIATVGNVIDGLFFRSGMAWKLTLLAAHSAFIQVPVAFDALYYVPRMLFVPSNLSVWTSA